MLGTRALWHRGWKVSSLGPAAPNAWGHFSSQRWELFNTDQDPSECHDLAGQEPDRLRELIDMWWVEAGRYQALPLETRNAVEAFSTPRPELSKPRARYTYFPGGAEVPESQAANIRGRSYTIAVEVTQPGKFGLGGGGLVVGRSGAEPVTDDHPGQRP
jgi:hypothetical protein